MAKLPSLSIIGEAHVNAVRNLLLGDFCIVLTNFGFRIGEGMPCTIPTHFVAYHVMSVIALYMKTSKKNGHHSAVPCVANVAVISYLGVQIFQQLHNYIFRNTTNSTAPFGTKHFQLLPSTHLLARLVGKTTFSRNGNLEIAADDFQIFRSLCNEPEKFKVAIKLFAQRGKNKTAQESRG